MKGLQVTRIIKEINFEDIWGELEAKNCFQIQPFTKYLRQTLVFMCNDAYGKVKFLFLKSFLLVLKKILFWQEYWALVYNSRKF